MGHEYRQYTYAELYDVTPDVFNLITFDILCCKMHDSVKVAKL